MSAARTRPSASDGVVGEGRGADAHGDAHPSLLGVIPEQGLRHVRADALPDQLGGPVLVLHADGDLALQPVSHDLRAGERRAGQDDGELLAAVARHDVDLAPQLPLQDVGDLAQHLVTGEVAVRVVEALEVVEVEHEERQWRTVPLRLRHLLLEPLVEVAVVVEPGETVGDRLQLEGLVQASVLERHGGLVGEDLDQLDLVLGEAPRAGVDGLDVPLHPVADEQRDGDAPAGLADSLPRSSRSQGIVCDRAPRRHRGARSALALLQQGEAEGQELDRRRPSRARPRCTPCPTACRRPRPPAARGSRAARATRSWCGSPREARPGGGCASPPAGRAWRSGWRPPPVRRGRTPAPSPPR